jgi:deoxyribodipyrimidine photolyase-related protein
VVALGDQLDPQSAALDGFDPAADAVWMAEVREESTHVWSTKPRTAVFLAAMRHFRDALRGRGFTVHYTALTDPDNRGSLAAELAHAVRTRKPKSLVMVEPGDYRVWQAVQGVADEAGVPLDVRTDRHFLTTVADFQAHAAGRSQLRMEFFYREVRKRTGVLMDGRDPAGGAWNYDAENRGSFGKGGPGLIPDPVGFRPDAVTAGVLADVQAAFAAHPGGLAHFDWPITPADADRALADFVANRLPSFGDYQDAMWTGRPYLYHARLSQAMNLKLLDPRRVVAAAEQAYRDGHAPLAAVEGFIRQVLGWREYVRGVYWRYMPDYLTLNALGASRPLPACYWTGDTDLNCLRQAVTQTLEYGYAHHIQRLMVLGLFALLLGVEPKQVHEWFLAVYVDAVEWVEAPNVLGMSQFADGGRMASKPYAASGKYIDRMSNYCTGCRYDPAKSVGPDACPVTTLYWDFLMRHEDRLAKNPRMVMQVKNLRRLTDADRAAIREQAGRVALRMCR